MDPIAYLTLEIKEREFDSRLLIAAHLLKEGFAVLLGQQWALFSNFDALPPGIVLFKTVNRIQAQNMVNARRCGHVVTTTDEEVLVCVDEESFTTSYDLAAAENCDLFFTQSDRQKRAIERKFPQMHGKLRTTGNSRIDLWTSAQSGTFAAKAREIREQYGPFVLFNTNYAQINSVWNSMDMLLAIAIKAGLVDAANPESVAAYRAQLEWEAANRDEMVAIIDWAVEHLKSHRIVIRPHPVEIPDYWRDRFGGKDRVLIPERSSPHPWILAADLVVHTSCTTGLEAILMGRPTVNLLPRPHPQFLSVTSLVNPTFSSWREAAPAIAGILAGGPGAFSGGYAKYADVLSEHFYSYKDGQSSKRIADGMMEMLRLRGATPRPGYQPKFSGGGFKSFKRSDVLKTKFTVGIEEMTGSLKEVIAAVGVPHKLVLAQVDDSLFFVAPA
jgi:surface carbohydrate biosynthesis protein